MLIKNHIFLLLLLLPPPLMAAKSAEQLEETAGTIAPSTIIIIAISVMFFLIATAAVAIRLFAEGCFGLNITDTAISTVAPPGLAADVIKSIPSYFYSDVKLRRLAKVELECAVCLSEFEDTDELRLLPACCHVFHLHCIDPWLASHVTCPFCRQSLIEPGSGTLVPHTTIDIPESEVESNGSDVAREVFDDDDQNHDNTLSVDYDKKKKLKRSHSTGHSLIGVDRFRLIKSSNRSVNRAGSGGGPLSSMFSPRNGYRGCNWFSMTPPIVHPRRVPVWSPKAAGLTVYVSKNSPLRPATTPDRLWPI